MNKWNYDEKYMHEQNHPLWKNTRLGHTTLTIGSDGCFSSDICYILSRKLGKDIGIPETVDKLNANNGYNGSGQLKYEAVKKLFGLTISRSKPWFSRVFIMRNVWVEGRYVAPDGHVVKHSYSHWVVELAGGLMYDSLRSGGNFVHELGFYRPVMVGSQINRRYVT